MPAAISKKIKVGDEVNVRLGKTIWRARVVEDRGPIGFKGRQLFRVQLFDDAQNVPQFLEVPLDDIESSRH